MRNRHHPRLCRTCTAPMAGHEATCWHCGAEWSSAGEPQATPLIAPVTTRLEHRDRSMSGVATAAMAA